MQYFVSNLLPRLKSFSLDLDRKEVFIDKPWVFIDENENQQKYIFKRDGQLLMSLNGQVTIGKWEYLSGAKSLLIDRISDKVLLNQNFVTEAVMILKKDGTKDQNLCLANELILPDFDINRYLQKLYYEKHAITTARLSTGDFLEIQYFNGSLKYKSVTIGGEVVPDGKFVVSTESGDKKVEVRNSTITKVLIKRSYDTSLGKIFIEEEQDLGSSRGDFVYLEDNSIAPDGKYKLGLFNTITVKDGIIIK